MNSKARTFFVFNSTGRLPNNTGVVTFCFETYRTRIYSNADSGVFCQIDHEFLLDQIKDALAEIVGNPNKDYKTFLPMGVVGSRGSVIWDSEAMIACVVGEDTRYVTKLHTLEAVNDVYQALRMIKQRYLQ